MMIEEIIYTSAQKGLKQGSRGFCTVVSTAGMGANLAERLESMSGYRHAFALHDPNVGLNPINYAHVTTRMAGRKLNVISRVADAGQDYSGRTNKLAQHIVLDESAMTAAGPGRLFADPKCFVTSWDGQLATTPPRVLPNPAIPEKVQLQAWAKITGDGGWAGHVAEQLLASRAPVNIIFAAGTDTLSLVTEVLDLIPVPQRWTVTFSTYFTRLLAGTECQLRFYLDGTAEATSIRNDARAVKVDLTSKLPAATGGALVEKAAAGVLEFPKSTAKPVVKPAAAKVKTTAAPVTTDRSLDELLDLEAADQDSQSATYSLQKTAATTPGPPTSAPPPVSRSGIDFQKKQGSGRWIIAGLAVVLLGALGAAVFLLRDEIRKIVDHKEQPLHKKEAALDPETTVASVEGTTDRKEERDHAASVNSVPMVPETPAEKDHNATPDKAPSPYGERTAFEELRKQLDSSEQSLVWKLPSSSTGKRGTKLKLLVQSPSELSISSPNLKELKFGELRKGEKQSEWSVRYGKTNLGIIVFQPQQAPEPSLLEWKWDAAVIKNTDATSEIARSVRAFRGAKITFDSGADGDQIALDVREADLDPFRYVNRTNGIAYFDLPEYQPALIEKDRTSPRIYIEAAKPSDVKLSVVDGFNAIVAKYQVSAKLDSAPPKSEVAKWGIGLGLKPVKAEEPEGGDKPPPAEPPEVKGYYFVTKTHGESQVSLHFEWLENINSEDAPPIQWAPLRLTIGESKLIVFPTRPHVVEALNLADLSQSTRATFARELNSPLKLKPKCESFVNLRIKDVEASFSPQWKGAKSEEDNGEDGQAKDQKDQPAEKECFHFALTKSADVFATAPYDKENILGHCSLWITPPSFSEDKTPLTMKCEMVTSLNRLSAAEANRLKLADVTKNDLWDGETLKEDEYGKLAQEVLLELNQIERLVPKGQRAEDQPTHLKRTGDTPTWENCVVQKFETIQDLLKDRESKLTAKVNKFRFGLEESQAKIAEQPAVSEADVRRIVRAREIDSAKKNMESQLAAMRELRKQYETKQIEKEKEVVTQFKERLAATNIQLTFAVSLKDGDDQLTLVLLTSEKESP